MSLMARVETPNRQTAVIMKINVGPGTKNPRSVRENFPETRQTPGVARSQIDITVS